MREFDRPLAVRMKTVVEHRWFLPATMALALALRLAFALLLPQQPHSDGTFYFNRARDLAAGLGYRDEGLPTAYWPVGYPGLLAGAMLLFGPTMLAPLAVNLLATAATLPLVAWFGHAVAGSTVAGRLAALLYAIYPAHIAYAGAPLSEVPSTAVAMAAFALLIAGRHGGWRMIAAGLLFGAATLMRTQMLLFPIGALFLTWLAFRDFGARRAAGSLFLLYVGIAAVTVPWSLRNHAVLGTRALSTNGGVALYTGASPRATGDFYEIDKATYAATGVPFSSRIADQVALDRGFKDAAVGWIADNPGRYAALGFKKVALVWLKDSDAFWGVGLSHRDKPAVLLALKAGNQAWYVLLLALAVPCALATVRAVFRGDPDRRRLVCLWAMPIFVVLTAFVFTGQIRYHFPAMPFLVVAAAWTLARVAGGAGRASPARPLRSEATVAI